KGKHHRAVLMYVLPCLGWRDGKVDPKVVVSRRLSVQDRNDKRLSFSAKPGMDLCFALNQNADAEGAPDTMRPPASLSALNPICCWYYRERMDDPRLADMRMQYDSMNIGEAMQ